MRCPCTGTHLLVPPSWYIGKIRAGGKSWRKKLPNAQTCEHGDSSHQGTNVVLWFTDAQRWKTAQDIIQSVTHDTTVLMASCSVPADSPTCSSALEMTNLSPRAERPFLTLPRYGDAFWGFTEQTWKEIVELSQISCQLSLSISEGELGAWLSPQLRGSLSAKLPSQRTTWLRCNLILEAPRFHRSQRFSPGSLRLLCYIPPQASQHAALGRPHASPGILPRAASQSREEPLMLQAALIA